MLLSSSLFHLIDSSNCQISIINRTGSNSNFHLCNKSPFACDRNIYFYTPSLRSPSRCPGPTNYRGDSFNAICCQWLSLVPDARAADPSPQ